MGFRPTPVDGLIPKVRDLAACLARGPRIVKKAHSFPRLQRNLPPPGRAGDGRPPRREGPNSTFETPSPSILYMVL